MSSARTLHLSVRELDGQVTSVAAPIDQLILVGYTGRDRAAVLDHIRELQDLGVAPPPSVPAMYEVSPALVTSEPRLVVGSPETSGEAEFYVQHTCLGVLIGVGSDHTDRRHEAIDIAESKGLCGKVISRDVWRLTDVEAHWDSLELCAWSTRQGERRVYQSGRLETLMRVPELLAEVAAAGLAAERAMVFGGTLPTVDGFVYASRFEVELHDPVLHRTLSVAYDIAVEGGQAQTTSARGG
jgi:hypothetical protein